jgi:hypothetical protein
MCFFSSLVDAHPTQLSLIRFIDRLKDTKDPDIVGPRGTIRGRLDSVLDNIKKNIVDCGNAIDKYYKSKFIG